MLPPWYRRGYHNAGSLGIPGAACGVSGDRLIALMLAGIAR